VVTPQQVYDWLVEFVATLPGTRVTLTWGEPHFRVGDKIFSGWGMHKDGRYAIGAKLDKDKQAALVASDRRFQIAPYVGKHGWVSFFPGANPDLGELEALLLESYRNIAPKALSARLRAGAILVAAPTASQSAKNQTRAAKPAVPRPAAAKTAKTAKTAKGNRRTMTAAVPRAAAARKAKRA
jgi:predicted DNA-binding protein (MmcQ/YjbR family)